MSAPDARLKAGAAALHNRYCYSNGCGIPDPQQIYDAECVLDAADVAEASIAGKLAAALRDLVFAATEEDPAEGWSEAFNVSHASARAVLSLYQTQETK